MAPSTRRRFRATSGAAAPTDAESELREQLVDPLVEKVVVDLVVFVRAQWPRHARIRAVAVIFLVRARGQSGCG